MFWAGAFLGRLNLLVEEPGVGACFLGLKHDEQDVERARGTKKTKRENWQRQITESPVIMEKDLCSHL